MKEVKEFKAMTKSEMKRITHQMTGKGYVRTGLTLTDGRYYLKFEKDQSTK